MTPSAPRRHLVLGTALLALAALLPTARAQAQETPIKFQLDWRFEGPAALFLVPVAKGYFKAEKLNVTVDAGNGSGGTVTRVAENTEPLSTRIISSGGPILAVLELNAGTAKRLGIKPGDHVEHSLFKKS